MKKACFRLTGKDPQAYSVYPDCLMKQLMGALSILVM